MQFGEAVHSAARTVKQPPLVVDDISSVPGGRAASTVEYEVCLDSPAVILQLAQRFYARSYIPGTSWPLTTEAAASLKRVN